MLYELWWSDTESSYCLRYFLDLSDRHVRPSDERIVWSTHADRWIDAIRAQHLHLGWEDYKEDPDYPLPEAPEKATYLVVNDYGMGGVWCAIDARSPRQILDLYPELQIVTERPAWYTPERQWNTHETAHFDIEDEPIGFLAALIAERP